MKGKWLLYLGLIVLALGILLKFIYTESFWPIAVIITGVAIKMYFIVRKISKRDYRPGAELLLLLAGLFLFFSGIYFSSNEINTMIHPSALKVSGLSLKVIFVLLFIRKMKVDE